MKKVLALVVAFALCFTAVAGCFAVSATAPVISINTDADTSFDISGTNYTAKIAQITELTVQNGLAVVDIYNGETKLVEYTPELDDEDEPEFDWVRSTDEDSNTVIKFLNVINAGESFTYTVNVDVENAQPGDYAITATIEAGDYEAEEIIDVADASAIFTVEAPHTCAPYGEPVVENKVDATCTTDGSYDSVVYCECGEEISRTPVTVPATGHTDGEVVEENNVAPTCTVDGSYDSVVYCSVCNAEISRTTVTVPATGHNYGTPVDNGDGTHTATCANNCGIPATEEHSYTEGTCACGKKESLVDENITCQLFGAGLGATTYVSFNSDPTKYPANTATVELVVNRNTKDNNYNFTPITDTIVYGAGDGLSAGNNTINIFYYYGIELYSYSVPITATIVCKDSSGNVIATSPSCTTTAVDALISNYNKSSKNDVKITIADAIIAATEAVKFLTETKQSSDYATKLLLPLDYLNTISDGLKDTILAKSAESPLDTSKFASYNTPNNGAITMKPTSGVAASPYIGMNTTGIAANERSNYEITFTFYNKLKNTDVIKTINMASTNSDEVLGGGTTWIAYFRDMTLYATNCEITATLKKVDTGETISTYSYCYDTVVSSNTNAKLTNVLNALAKLGQSSRAMNNIKD